MELLKIFVKKGDRAKFTLSHIPRQAREPSFGTVTVLRQAQEPFVEVQELTVEVLETTGQAKSQVEVDIRRLI